jgi:hypothetical protein
MRVKCWWPHAILPSWRPGSDSPHPHQFCERGRVERRLSYKQVKVGSIPTAHTKYGLDRS